MTKKVYAVSEQQIKDQIDSVTYHRIPDTTIILAIIKLKSGFHVTGQSSCVDPNTFNIEIGEKIAFENAFDQLWQLFSFELKQKIGSDFRSRLQREYNEVFERWEKLKTTTILVSHQQAKLLEQQREVMAQYVAILKQRLELLQ